MICIVHSWGTKDVQGKRKNGSKVLSSIAQYGIERPCIRFCVAMCGLVISNIVALSPFLAVTDPNSYDHLCPYSVI